MGEVLGRPYDDADKLKCLHREIALRRNVYAKRVREKSMKQADADRELGIMVAIANDYIERVRIASAEKESV